MNRFKIRGEFRSVWTTDQQTIKKQYISVHRLPFVHVHIYDENFLHIQTFVVQMDKIYNGPRSEWKIMSWIEKINDMQVKITEELGW